MIARESLNLQTPYELPAGTLEELIAGIFADRERAQAVDVRTVALFGYVRRMPPKHLAFALKTVLVSKRTEFHR